MPMIRNNISWLIREQGNCRLDSRYISKNIGKFKKVTATRFANLMLFYLQVKHHSEFKIWMEMVNMYKEAPAPIFSKVGNAIEPIIRLNACERFQTKWIEWDIKKIRYDAFKEDPIFSGVPDGEPINVDGKIDYSSNKPILEIKTSSIDILKYEDTGNGLSMLLDEDGYPIVVQPNKKRNEWFDSTGRIVIPLQYKLQLGFYLNLRKINSGIFAITFLEPADYKYPELYKIEKHEVHYVWLFIDTNEFQGLMNLAKSWFLKHVKGGISPVMTDEDQIWLNHEMKKSTWGDE